MYSPEKMQKTLGIMLLIGISIALGLVIVGGIFYLIHYGSDPLQMELLQAEAYQLSIKKICYSAFTLSPTGIIELGLLILVMTQLLRVAILAWFYFVMRDRWFTFFSGFILIMLIYSLIWRN